MTKLYLQFQTSLINRPHFNIKYITLKLASSLGVALSILLPPETDPTKQMLCDDHVICGLRSVIGLFSEKYSFQIQTKKHLL
jgi:hypothetical protein